MMFRRIILSVIASLPLVFSCSRPQSSEHFVRTENADESGAYRFALDFPEGEVYDLDLYVNMDCGNLKFAQFSGIGVSALWESPEGEKYSEEVFIGREYLDAGSFYGKRVVAPYREDLSMDPPGEWTLSLSMDKEAIETFGVTGIGIRATRK